MSRTPLVVAVALVLVALTSGAVAAGAVTAPDGAPVAALQDDGNGTATATPEPTATPAPTATPSGNDTTSNDTATTESDENGSFGVAVASFAQASAAEAEGDVEQGMFEAAVNRTNGTAREAVVQRRTTELSDRVVELRAERAAVLNDSDLPPAARQARAARITARIDELRSGINQTESVAERVGVNTSRLDRLRQGAADLSGPEVAEMARGIARDPTDPGFPGAGGGPPGDGDERGPPDGTPGVELPGDGDGNETVGPGNRTREAPGDGGPGDQAGNGSAGGPEDAGANRTGGPEDGGEDPATNRSGGDGNTTDGGAANSSDGSTETSNGTGTSDDGGSGDGGGPDDTGGSGDGGPSAGTSEDSGDGGGDGGAGERPSG